MWHFDFADILDHVHTLDGMEKDRFDANTLRAALDAVYSPLAEGGDELMVVGWMTKTMIKILRESPPPPSPGLKFES